MSLTATNAQVYKGTAAVTYGSGSGVSGSQLQGTATITYGGAPTSNTALVTGSSNYMKLPTTDPTNFDPSTSNVFIEAWVYWSGTNWTSPSLGTIYERDNLTVQDYGLYTDNTGKLTSYMYTQNGSILRAIYNTSSLNFQQWYHVAFAYNTVNQTSYVWVNGNVGTTSTASNPARYTGSSIFTSIGASPLNGVTTAYWNGYIRDMRVVKGGNIPTTSFTPAQAPFRLNVPSYVTGGSTVLSLYEQYFYPSWLSLPGPTGNYMNLGTNHPGHFDTASSNLFVECWFYSTGAGGGGIGQVQHIAAVSGASVTTTEVWGLFFYQGNYADFYMYNTTNSAFEARNTTSLQYNTWYHLAGSWDSVNKKTYVFVNGVVGATVGSLTGTARAFDPTHALQVGTDFFTGNTAKGYIQDLRVVQGGTVPTTTFTPGSAPFGLASPSYVSGGTTVLSLATQYYQTSMRLASTGTIQFTSRPILPAVLTNPGTQSFTLGQSLTISQTALEPANGITWTLAPTGQGVSIASSTDYALTLSTPTAVTQNLFTVSATNKAGLTTVMQFTGSTPSLSKVTVAPVAVYSLRGQKSTYTLAFNVRNGTTNATQDFYADTLGNLTTAAGSGQTLIQWLGGATGYITTWYDQSGNGNHASQGTTAYQPVITSALIASNIFGLNFQNSCGLTTSAFTNSLNVTLVMVIVIKNTIATWGNFAHHGQHDYDWSIRQNGLSPTYIHWHTNNDNTGDQLAIIYDTPMVLYCTMTNGTAMSFQMLTSTSSYVTTATESLTLTVGSKIMYIGKSDTSEACNSYIGEFNYFQSVLSATDQTAILSDVCSRWGITNFNPLFNTTSSTVTSAVLSAYSLRDLYGTSPVVVNVRRSSDNSTQDFYADTRGNLTTLSAGAGQTLASWLGGATGYVTTWYDQSGLGNHASQATSGNQPVIQSGTKGPGYMLSFTATQNQYLTGFAYSKLANTNYTVCEVDRRTASISPVTNGVDNAIISCGTNGVTDQCLHLTYRSGTTAYYGQFGDDYSVPVTAFTTASTEPVRFRFHMASSTSGSGRRIYVYGDPLGYVTNFITGNTALLSASGVGNFYIGYYFNGPTYYQGELYETIVFNNSLYDLDNTAKQIATIYDSQYDYINTPK